MSVSPAPDTGQAAATLPPRWQRWLPRGAAATPWATPPRALGCPAGLACGSAWRCSSPPR